MDSPEDREPFVMIDDEEAPPIRPFPWHWGAMAGVLLVAALGSVAFFHGRRPPPSPVALEEVAFVPVDPAPPEAPAAPAEPVAEAPLAASPANPPPAPASTPPGPELPAIAEEAPDVPPSPAPAKGPTRLETPTSTAPALKEALILQKQLASAAAAISDAKPIFDEIAERFDAPAFGNGDILELAAKMDRVEEKLREAQEIYARVRERALDPRILDLRLEAIRDLLESLRDGRARIRVPFALRKSEVLRNEAALLAKEALDGFQPFSREAQALDVRAEVAAAKLREARRLTVSIRADVADPERVDQSLRDIDSQLERLEGRYPDVKSAR